MACRRCGKAREQHTQVDGVGLVCPVAAMTFEEGAPAEPREDAKVAPGTADGSFRYDGGAR